MKKIILSAIVLLVLGVTGCKNNNNTGDPRAVLMSFMDALGKKDIENAKKYATKDSEGMLGMIQFGMTMAPDSTTDKMYDKSNIEFGNAKIDGDKATVPVIIKNSGDTLNFSLNKESGSWKVAFDMFTMMQMGKEKMKEKGMDMNSGMDSASKMLEDMNKSIDSSRAKIDTAH
ncbi:MAG TPA: hypothetical protein VMY77_09575 [Chitinophagaceae bacterium]|nr:hypothetical protein [Chitinophagaceae bacterium]